MKFTGRLLVSASLLFATLIGGFTGIPFVITQTPDGAAEYVSEVRRFSGGGADRLVRIDAATQEVTRDVYTFNDAGKSVRDMKIVGINP